MKTIKTILLIALALFAIKATSKYANQMENPNEVYEADKQPVIIWNDDYETIPPTGDLVKVDFVSNDTIYLVNP